jgi:hypothetical protein
VEYDQAVDEVDTRIVETLNAHLDCALISTRDVPVSSEAFVLQLVGPIMLEIASTFNDLRIHMEEDFAGKRVKAHGRFELTVMKDSRIVCIIEVKKADLLQGMAQALVGAEVATELSQGKPTCAIVTDFDTWIFLKILDKRVYSHSVHLTTGSHRRFHLQNLRNLLGKVKGIIREFSLD